MRQALANTRQNRSEATDLMLPVIDAAAHHTKWGRLSAFAVLPRIYR